MVKYGTSTLGSTWEISKKCLDLHCLVLHFLLYCRYLSEYLLQICLTMGKSLCFAVHCIGCLLLVCRSSSVPFYLHAGPCYLIGFQENIEVNTNLCHSHPDDSRGHRSNSRSPSWPCTPPPRPILPSFASPPMRAMMAPRPIFQTRPTFCSGR